MYPFGPMNGYDNFWNSEHYSGFSAERGRVIPVELTSSEEEQNSLVYYSLILPHHEQVNFPSLPAFHHLTMEL